MRRSSGAAEEGERRGTEARLGLGSQACTSQEEASSSQEEAPRADGEEEAPLPAHPRASPQGLPPPLARRPCDGIRATPAPGWPAAISGSGAAWWALPLAGAISGSPGGSGGAISGSAISGSAISGSRRRGVPSAHTSSASPPSCTISSDGSRLRAGGRGESPRRRSSARDGALPPSRLEAGVGGRWGIGGGSPALQAQPTPATPPVASYRAKNTPRPAQAGSTTPTLTPPTMVSRLSRPPNSCSRLGECTEGEGPHKCHGSVLDVQIRAPPEDSQQRRLIQCAVNGQGKEEQPPFKRRQLPHKLTHHRPAHTPR
eukprot:scaffold14781_cov113-Isochrysis_galbana.AAC.1